RADRRRNHFWLSTGDPAPLRCACRPMDALRRLDDRDRLRPAARDRSRALTLHSELGQIHAQARERNGGRPSPAARGAQMPARVASQDVTLSIEHVAVHFGGLVALSDLNFTVCNGEIVGLIGPNGAGKTTAFNVFTGFLKPTAGEVRYRNTLLNGLKPHEI